MLIFAGFVIFALLFLLSKGGDARLLLLTAGFLLCAVSGHWRAGPDAFASGLCRSDVLQSICATLGFVSVIRTSHADEALVERIAAVSCRTPLLLIFGASFLAFILNLSLPTGSGVTAVVGTTFIPLMIRSGISPVIAASAVLSGTFGSMLCPGFAQLAVLQSLLGVPPETLIHKAAVPTCAAFAIVCVWNLIATLGCHQKQAVSPITSGRRYPLCLAPAPLIPLMIYLVGSACGFRPTVVSAVLIGTLYLCLTASRSPAELCRHFFDGMGRAFTSVFAITVCASVFTQGLQVSGTLSALHEVLPEGEKSAWLFAAIPFATAVLTGSSDAVTLAVNQSFALTADTFGLSPAAFGLLVAEAAQHGRIVSPIAGATLIAASMASISPLAVCRYLLLPFTLGTILITLLYQ